MKKLTLFFVSVFQLLFYSGSAQDTLYKTTSEKLIGKIFFIDTGGVSMRRERMENDSTWFSKYEISKIVYKNHLEINFTNDLLKNMEDVTMSMLTEAAKIEFAGLLAGKIVGGYEFYLSKNKSLDLRAGYIGLNFTSLSDFNASSGLLIKAGQRFYSKAKYAGLANRFSHPLKGNYFMPQLIYSSFKKEKILKDELTGKQVPVNARVNSYGLNIVYGRQIIAWDGFILDYSFGIGVDYQENGYPKNSAIDSDNYEQYVYSHLHIGKSIGLVVTAGFAIGGLL